MQVHAWITAMSLKSKTIQPWDTLKHHPFAVVPVETSKRPQTRSLQVPSKKLRLTPAASKPAHPKPSNQAAAGNSSQEQQSLSVAPCANASLPNTASPLWDRLCPEHAAQQAASDFSIASIHSVLAVGTSGPVFNARYTQHTSTVIHMLNLSTTPVLVVSLTYAHMCAL